MNQIEQETALIHELETKDCTKMSMDEFRIHLQEIKDAFWRRRMASRTPEEVERNVYAP